jgi:hypothetical protein
MTHTSPDKSLGASSCQYVRLFGSMSHGSPSVAGALFLCAAADAAEHNSTCTVRTIADTAAGCRDPDRPRVATARTPATSPPLCCRRTDGRSTRLVRFLSLPVDGILGAPSRVLLAVVVAVALLDEGVRGRPTKADRSGSCLCS